MELSGVHVSTEDTADGVALTFATPDTDQVAELRRRVRAVAATHNMKPPKGAACCTPMSGEAKMVPSTATVQDIPGGAQLVLAPKDPSQIGKLRFEAKERAAVMKTGVCTTV